MFALRSFLWQDSWDLSPHQMYWTCFYAKFDWQFKSTSQTCLEHVCIITAKPISRPIVKIVSESRIPSSFERLFVRKIYTSQVSLSPASWNQSGQEEALNPSSCQVSGSFQSVFITFEITYLHPETAELTSFPFHPTVLIETDVFQRSLRHSPLYANISEINLHIK